MRKLLLGALALLLLVSAPAEAAASVTRRDGFLLIWEGIRRPAAAVRGTPFADVPPGARGFTEISYAESRGLLDGADAFRPDEPLSSEAALLWTFRTRNVDDDRLFPDDGQERDSTVVPEIAERMGLGRYVRDGVVKQSNVTPEELTEIVRRVDTFLADEDHEVSLYSEKFHGKGTAFGETFDMHAMTAAHRTFPHNTLVRVTNLEDGRSVVVRINDRGPYVQGRDMDLSLGSFISIAPRSRGKIRAKFTRLGDATLVGTCHLDAVQTRVGPKLRLTQGVPQAMRLGTRLTLAAKDPFVIVSVTYPDGTREHVQDWVQPGETYGLTPSIEGVYRITVGTVEGRRRVMETVVTRCADGA